MTFELPLPPTPTLETERLILRPLAATDAPAVQRQFPDFEVVKYLHAGVPWPYPPNAAEAYVAKCLEQRARGEKFHWGVTLKAGPQDIIGMVDLWPFDGETRSMRGFWLARDFWGRGLMTEAVERVTAFAFDDLQWPFLYLANAAPNHGSHRVKEKQGAEVIDVRLHQYMSGEFPRVTWILTREAWTARKHDRKRA